ncbi:amidohydrolase [Formosa sp. S-31]|uniref:amidohydrolase n=1 Tax=Formosa sp. S-31 TaxID=2790949 RepID=UPI003EBC48E7
MSEFLKIALLQTDLIWEDPKANRLNLEAQIREISETSDLIVLPEMFTTGFTMQAEPYAEFMEGTTIQWMKSLAGEKGSAIAGSLIISEEGNLYNRLVFVTPDGHVSYYDKRHTFTLAGEDRVYTSGRSRAIISYKGWNICPLICYDLRFPVWARYQEDYDVLLYVANWPKPRINAWDTLLQARAIENMSYCVGVNRVGQDSKGHEYTGHSAAYSPLGEPLTGFLPGEKGIRIVSLHKQQLQDARAKFKFLNDRDAFTLLE